jgi:molybdopterin adenylyltransferase
MSDKTYDPVKIGLLTVSDRASKGIYQDEGIPALEAWVSQVVLNPVSVVKRVIPDEQALIETTLRELVDSEKCSLVLTTGGTGPAPRDVTPDATLAVAERVLDGFGEAMRMNNLKYVATAILSRQVAVIRKQTLIINLPGQPKAIKETLDGVFAAVPYCVDLIGGPYIETREEFVKAFRPKSAIRQKNPPSQ